MLRKKKKKKNVVESLILVAKHDSSANTDGKYAEGLIYFLNP